MIQVVFNIPDAVAPRLLDALCGAWNYDRNKLEGETKAQFVKRRTRDYWMEVGASYEASSAATTAAENQKTDFNSAIQVT